MARSKPICSAAPDQQDADLLWRRGRQHGGGSGRSTCLLRPRRRIQLEVPPLPVIGNEPGCLHHGAQQLAVAAGRPLAAGSRRVRGGCRWNQPAADRSLNSSNPVPIHSSSSPRTRVRSTAPPVPLGGTPPQAGTRIGWHAPGPPRPRSRDGAHPARRGSGRRSRAGSPGSCRHPRSATHSHAVGKVLRSPAPNAQPPVAAQRRAASRHPSVRGRSPTNTTLACQKPPTQDHRPWPRKGDSRRRGRAPQAAGGSLAAGWRQFTRPTPPRRPRSRARTPRCAARPATRSRARRRRSG